MRATLLQLFLTFAKIGVCAFGGGYAMLPLFQRELVENRGWAKEDDITDYYALSQCTPGLLAVNTAVYVAFPLRGPAGAVAASLGVITPSAVIVLLLAWLLQSYAHLPVVEQAFAGVRVAVIALLVHAVYKLFKSGVKDKPAFIIFIAAFVLGLLSIVSPILTIVSAAIAGMAIHGAKKPAKGGGL